jgi:uncharacterized protein (DUF362 family)
MSDDLTRRDFLKRAAALGLVAAGLGELGLSDNAEAATPLLAVAAKGDPASRTRAAIGALGGLKKFVKKGDVVLVKPNLSWARKPEQAATTNPEVVAEIVRLCREAGAKEVRVMDHPVDRPDSLVLRMTGMEALVKAAGGRLALASSAAMYQQVALRKGKALKTTEVLRDVLKADVFINVPIAKVHNSTGLTLGMKNLLGIVWDRGAYHQSSSIDQAIVDLAQQVKPHLTILDANRILLTNGPKGPGKTEDKGLVIAGIDPVAVDAYGATLFGQKPSSVGHIKLAAAAKLGQSDLKKVTIRNV